MHELAITQNLLDLSLRYAEAAHVRRVTGLQLVLGELSSVVDDSIQFYWDIISRRTIAEGAVLSFERRAATLKCCDCGHVFALNHNYICSKCRSKRVVIQNGDEFYLESIQVED